MNDVFQLISALLIEIDKKEEKENLYDYVSFKMAVKGEVSEKDYKKFKLANEFYRLIMKEMKNEG